MIGVGCFVRVLLVGIDFKILMIRPSGDDVATTKEMDSSHVEFVGELLLGLHMSLMCWRHFICCYMCDM